MNWRKLWKEGDAPARTWKIHKSLPSAQASGEWAEGNIQDQGDIMGRVQGACRPGTVEGPTQEQDEVGLVLWVRLDWKEPKQNRLKRNRILSLSYIKASYVVQDWFGFYQQGARLLLSCCFPVHRLDLRVKKGHLIPFLKKGEQSVWVLTLRTGLLRSYQLTPHLLPPRSLDHTQLQGSLGKVVFVLATSHPAKNDDTKQEESTNIQGQQATYVMKGVSILHHGRWWIIEEFWGGEW